jgi:HAD superfamily hydrolase (TIGR01662 family)
MIEAVCFDLGDTLVSEESIVHDEGGHALTASLVPGAREVLARTRKEKYKTALIANADGISARNVIASCSLEDYFDVMVISGEVGIEKPDTGIFHIALDRLGVRAGNAVMVGNRINADIHGAKQAGMKSVWFSWDDRYHDTIDSEDAVPDFVIHHLSELPGILNLL